MERPSLPGPCHRVEGFLSRLLFALLYLYVAINYSFHKFLCDNLFCRHGNQLSLFETPKHTRAHQRLCRPEIPFMWQYHPTLLYLPCVSVPFIHKQYGHSFGFSLSQFTACEESNGLNGPVMKKQESSDGHFE